MFFTYPQDFKERELLPRVTTKVIWGERMLFSFVTILPDAPVPPLHSHPNEQMGVVLEGEFGLTIGAETKKIKKGDTFLIPPNVPHGIAFTCEKEAKVLDVFSPPREEFKK